MEDRYLGMSDDDLLLEIGDALFKQSFGAKPMSDAEKRQAGTRWFEANISSFRDRICQDTTFRAQFAPAARERNEIFRMLIDIVAAHFIGVPAGAVAAKLLNYGLGKLCPQWGMQNAVGN